MANRLADQTSPYLRQHADNPVDWQPWSDEAFAEARARDVPVLLSVGYSSCHWCHVMAHESFEDPEVAAVMNRWFVPVKVDREERPDIDAVYMEATQAMTGRGGWPMTVFMDPFGRPFYCGTYFPPVRRGGMPGFVELMEAVHDAWTERRDELTEQADQLTAALGRDVPRSTDAALDAAAVLAGAAEGLLGAADPTWGGFGRAPKFPQTLGLAHLLGHHLRTGSAPALEVLTTSLDAMASGGMVDLIGGGFSRYSVDERWLVPHFEKMLYDNALLTRLYARAHVATGTQRWAQVVQETIDYVLSELSHPGGGRFSAQDADSLPTPDAAHAEEGAFYTFTPDEVAGILTAAGLAGHIDDACAWWGITEAGNFEGRSIPNRLHERGRWERPEHIDRARTALAAARARRPRPGLDDKVLTEWNALWVTAVAEAGSAMGRDGWIAEAERTAEFLCTHLRREDGRWLRSWQADSADTSGGGGRALHLAYGADHAALVEAFVALHSATGRQRWLQEATDTAGQLLDLFWDPEGGIHTTGTDAEALLVRPKDTMDDATPSASSSAAVGLLQLGALTGDRRWTDAAEAIVVALGPLAARAPLGFGHLLTAVHMYATGMTEVVITGDRPDLVAVAHTVTDPSVVLTWGEAGGGPLWEGRGETGTDGRAYVCRGFTCEAPSVTPEQLAAQLQAPATSS